MKKIIKSLLFFITLLALLASSGCGSISGLKTTDAEPIDIGIPSADNYAKGSAALYISDMIIHDGRLFIADGDYDTNTGPTNIMAYDLENKTWEISGTVPDEAVRRFVIADAALIAPGVDPMDDWSLGNYYVYDSGEWKVKRVIPNGIHNFDMVSFNNKYYAALGVESGLSPVASSENGEDFQPVEFLKDGRPPETETDDVTRCYDLFVLNEKLYALYVNIRGNALIAYEMYELDESAEAFVFKTDLLGRLAVRADVGPDFVNDRLAFNGQMFIATGHLAVSSDMDEFYIVHFPNDADVWDVYSFDGALYVLTSSEKEDGGYDISVYKNTTEETLGFSLEMRFTYDIPATSFAVSEESMFFGMCNNLSYHEMNGMVLEYLR